MFPNKFAVKTHISTKHYKCDKQICLYCSKGFDKSDEKEYKSHLQIHLVREQENNKFSCVITNCNQSFTNSIDLKTHVLEQHDVCSKCDICQAVSQVLLYYDSM